MSTSKTDAELLQRVLTNLDAIMRVPSDHVMTRCYNMRFDVLALLGRLEADRLEAPAAQEPIARVSAHTGALLDMSIIVWLGEQPPPGTLLYAAPVTGPNP